jgi:hypothetical protein
VAELTDPRSLSSTRANVMAMLAQPVAAGAGAAPAPRGMPAVGETARAELLASLGVRDSAALAALDSVTLFERLVGSALPRHVAVMLADVLGEDVADDVGVVPEGDSIAHVVRRARFVGPPPAGDGMIGIVRREQGARMDVATLRRAGPRAPWRVLTETGFELDAQVHLRTMMTRMRMGASTTAAALMAVQVGDSVQRARVTPDSVAIDIPVSFTNTGRDTAHVTWCRFTLDQRADPPGPRVDSELAAWGEAHAQACPAGARGPVPVAPGARAGATLLVRALRGRAGPVWAADSVAGTYRVLLHVTRPAPPGRARSVWPDYMRASAPFRVDVAR